MRTFIGIELSATVQQWLDKFSNALQSHFEAHRSPNCLRWSPVSNAHLTLCFPGETSEAQAERIASELVHVVAAHLPFELTLGRIGGFPTLSQPQVIWAGVDGNLDKLHQLQSDIQTVAKQVGFDLGERPYSPHVTLARSRRRETKIALRHVGELLREVDSTRHLGHTMIASTPFSVTEVVHFQSERRPLRPVYTQITRIELGPKPNKNTRTSNRRLPTTERSEGR